jgi:hypothetical protein
MPALTPSLRSASNEEPSLPSSDCSPHPTTRHFLFVHRNPIGSSASSDQPSRSTIGSHVQKTLRRKRLEERTLRFKYAKFPALARRYHPDNHDRLNKIQGERPAKEPSVRNGRPDTDHDTASALFTPDELVFEPTEQRHAETAIDSTPQALIVSKSSARSINDSRAVLPPLTEVVDFPSLEATTAAFEHCELNHRCLLHCKSRPCWER